MMNSTVKKIKRLIEFNKIHEADQLLSQLALEKNPEVLAELFSLFDDNFEYDELMFSIIHSVEMLENNTYVRSYLNNIEKMFESSPRWTSILLIRIVNNTETLSILKETIKGNRNLTATVNKVREIALKIKRDMPQLDR